MNNLMSNLFADQLITALCNTLLYSLLGGVFLATICGLVVMFTAKLSAATRYNLLVGALGIFALGMLVVFGMQFESGEPITFKQVANNAAIGNYNVTAPVIQPVVINAEVQAAKVSYIDVISNYVNDHHDTIVLIWFLVICIKGIQLMLGLRGVYRLKYDQVVAVSDSWNERLKQMAESLGVTQKVALLGSGLAKVPMAVGYLRPVILMPVGLLTALSMQDIEAILMHELAHIRRRDYLVNLLQSVVEIVFFFNPAVLWVSALIRTEREHCCDDIALTQNTGKAAYIKALVSCEEYRSAAPGYAMAMSGNKNNLLDRVKRLVSNRNIGLNTFEKTFFTVCLIISGICFSAFASKQPIKAVADKMIAAIMPKDAKEDKEANSSAKSVESAAVDSLASISPEKDKADPTAPLDSAQEKTMEDAWVKMLIRNDSLLKITADEEWAKMDPKVTGTVQRGLSAKRSYIFNHIQVEIVKDGLVSGKGRSVSARSFSINQDEFVVNGQKQPEALHKKYLDMLQSVPGTSNYSYNTTTKVTQNTDTVRKGDNKIKPQKFESSVTHYDVTPTMPSAPPANNAYLDDAAKAQKRTALLNDLLKEGLIKNTTKLSFTLTDDQFILNGIKQTANVHQKYKNRYLTGKLMSWQFAKNGEGNVSEQFGERVDAPAKVDTTKRRHYIVNAYGNLYMDSVYRSKGYNDAKHMAVQRTPDTSKYVPTPSPFKTLRDEMVRDGLIAKDLIGPNFKLGRIGEDSIVFTINGIKQSEALAKKYIAIQEKFRADNPAPPRWIDPNETLIREKMNYLMNGIIVQLLKDGLTKDKAPLWYTLDHNGFMLNGKQQPPEVYQKYFDLFIKPTPGGRSTWKINEFMAP